MKISYQLEKCMEIDSISLSCYHELCNFAKWLQDACDWTDRRTHYQGLDEWLTPKNQIISKNLDKFGFINGKGSTNNDSAFWWVIHQLEPCYSLNLVTEVSSHHSSAWERNNCMLIEIEHLISQFENKIK